MNTATTIPAYAQRAFKAGTDFAHLVYRGHSALPAFAILNNEAGQEALLFDSKPGEKQVTLEAIRQTAPGLARQHQAYAATFGATALIAKPQDDAAAQALKNALKDGASLSDRPGSVPALLLEYHTRNRIVRAAFLIDDQGSISNDPQMVVDAPAGEASPIANIRFFPPHE